MTEAEREELRKNLRVLGVRSAHINPKALSLQHLVGVYDPELLTWTEGVLSSTVKAFTGEVSREM